MCKFFSPEEFAKCVPSCNESDCNPDALKRLDTLREIAGIPIRLNSAYRSPEWDKSKGRTGKGVHTRGCAFDLSCWRSDDRWRIVHAAMAAGFHRIGIADTFVHVDCDTLCTEPRIWLY